MVLDIYLEGKKEVLQVLLKKEGKGEVCVKPPFEYILFFKM